MIKDILNKRFELSYKWTKILFNKLEDELINDNIVFTEEGIRQIIIHFERVYIDYMRCLKLLKDSNYRTACMVKYSDFNDCLFGENDLRKLLKDEYISLCSVYKSYTDRKGCVLLHGELNSLAHNIFKLFNKYFEILTERDMKLITLIFDCALDYIHCIFFYIGMECANPLDELKHFDYINKVDEEESEPDGSLVKDKIKHLRKLFMISQDVLAKRVGVGKTTISNYETGYSKPDIATLLKLSNIFGVSTDFLLGNEKDNKAYNLDINAMK